MQYPDSKNMDTREFNKIILEVRAGAGGDEAALFAGDLVRMYQRYAAQRGWKFAPIDFSVSSARGYKTYVGEIAGQGVYNALRHESGVHRVQRIPETETRGRIHTSTASVAVLPEVEPNEVQINPQDLEISFFRSSGPGGQNVNKVETAVRIQHIPTGLVVSSQNGRSQANNREYAMGMLRAKLFEEQKNAEAAKIGGLRREQIGSGDRSEKIRTYNFPEDRITDHRIKKKFHNIEKVLDGELDLIVKAFEKNITA